MSKYLLGKVKCWVHKGQSLAMLVTWLSIRTHESQQLILKIHVFRPCILHLNTISWIVWKITIQNPGCRIPAMIAMVVNVHKWCMLACKLGQELSVETLACNCYSQYNINVLLECPAHRHPNWGGRGATAPHKNFLCILIWGSKPKKV